MAVDVSTIIAGGIIAVGNVGAVGVLVNRTLNRLDATEKTTNEHSILLAQTAEILAGVQNQVAQVAEDQRELYESRNDHKEELVAIDTLHNFKGCKVLNQGGR